MRLSDVYRIEVNSYYCERLKKLYALRGEKHAPIKQTATDQMLNLLSYAKEESKVIAISLLDGDIDDVIGLVTCFDEHCVEVKQYDRSGTYDGETDVLIDDINHIDCDGDMEYSIKLLLQADNIC